jgi:hypothetical protein
LLLGVPFAVVVVGIFVVKSKGSGKAGIEPPKKL